MSRTALFLAVLCSAVALSTATSPLLKATTFEAVKSAGGDALVLFYFSEHPNGVAALEALSGAADAIHAAHPEYEFRTVDGSSEANAKDFAAAQFTDRTGTWLFTATAASGIERALGESALTSDAIVAHIKEKHAPSTAEDVIPFSDETSFDALVNGGTPVFVKFFEKWCGHCKAMAKSWQQSATAFKETVKFYEVECSKTTESTAFCQKYGVRGYPTIKLFASSKGGLASPIPYDSGSRTISAFRDFFAKQLTVSTGGVAEPSRAEL